jgi:hypothetical protein
MKKNLRQNIETTFPSHIRMRKKKNYSSILRGAHDARREETNLLKAKNTQHHRRNASLLCNNPRFSPSLFSLENNCYRESFRKSNGVGYEC